MIRLITYSAIVMFAVGAAILAVILGIFLVLSGYLYTAPDSV